MHSQRITEITHTEVDALQQATLGQSSNPTWRAERLKRLTSSTYGRICKMMDRTNGDALTRSLLADHDINSELIHSSTTRSSWHFSTDCYRDSD